MASLLENLIDVLDREHFEYEKLLILAEKKTTAVVKSDVESLSDITEDEQEIVGRIQSMEKQRIKVLADVANVVNRDVEDLILTNIIQMLEPRPAEQQKLAKVHDRLKTVVHQVRQVNEQNRDLILNALEMIEFDINMFQAMKAAPETANYNKGAYSAGSVIGVSRNGFDAKQ